jgi:ABC-2 type transport system permease protein
LRLELPPPLTEAPPPRSFGQDFKLLLAAQLRVTWNKIRHWPRGSLIGMLITSLLFVSLFVYLAQLSYGVLNQLPPDIARGFLSLIFMAGFGGLIFFGITAAFATLYMSDDLELLFMAPVSTRAVFAVKSLVVAGSNSITVLIFIFLPALFYGLLFGAGPLFYLWAALASAGLWASGTAAAEFLNLLVMRLVPPHRSREAVGVLGGMGGLLIALFFQIPNLVTGSSGRLDLPGWLNRQRELLQVMDFFPWGWGSRALAGSAAGNQWAGLGWSLLLLALGAVILAAAFLLVERGFRRGWISLSQDQGGRRRKRRRNLKSSAGRARHEESPRLSLAAAPDTAVKASSWRGMWAVTKKDLLYLKRDTREWFGYMIPLIVLAFFIGQYIFLSSDSSRSSLVSVLMIYTIMFSGNMAAQSFGREGESEWILNSVPLAGWPVVWGKLFAAALPTLILMELMLGGTALATGLSYKMTLLIAAGALLLTFAASAIGLFFSINNCRYHPDNPRQRIAPGATWMMFLINLVLIVLMSAGLLYIFAPVELTNLLQKLPPVAFSWSFPGLLLYFLSLLARPFFWAPVWRIVAGTVVAGGVWAAFFFGFMAATVRQSRKGFRVEIVTAAKRIRLK